MNRLFLFVVFFAPLALAACAATTHAVNRPHSTLAMASQRRWFEWVIRSVDCVSSHPYCQIKVRQVRLGTDSNVGFYKQESTFKFGTKEMRAVQKCLSATSAPALVDRHFFSPYNWQDSPDEVLLDLRQTAWGECGEW